MADFSRGVVSDKMKRSDWEAHDEVKATTMRAARRMAGRIGI
jgi:hypothetical protein